MICHNTQPIKLKFFDILMLISVSQLTFTLNMTCNKEVKSVICSIFTVLFMVSGIFIILPIIFGSIATQIITVNDNTQLYLTGLIATLIFVVLSGISYRYCGECCRTRLYTCIDKYRRRRVFIQQMAPPGVEMKSSRDQIEPERGSLKRVYVPPTTPQSDIKIISDNDPVVQHETVNVIVDTPKEPLNNTQIPSEFQDMADTPTTNHGTFASLR